LNTSEQPIDANIPRRQLTWLDATSVSVGTIVGAGIFQTAGPVASSVDSPWLLFVLWLFGGLFSLCGAMCYAELASAFPKAGGDYIYLKQAYGDWAGFLFGWSHLLVIRPGDIAIIAFTFATYFPKLLPIDLSSSPGAIPMIASLAVALLTIINILGVQQSKWTQNILTIAKVVGLLAIAGLAFLHPAATASTANEVVSSDRLPIGVALILVLFTFGGWNEMAYLAGEVKNPERNLVSTLLSGTIIVTALYLLINLAFLHVLGLAGMSHSKAIAAETLDAIIPAKGSVFVSLLICISTLGTVNGMILTGSRIGYAMGKDHRLFQPLGHWDPRTSTPIIALVVQGVIAITLIVLLGSFISAVLYTSAAVYAFYLATGIAVFVMRRRNPDLVRPYRVTLYPLPLVVFASTCVYLICSAVEYKPLMAGFVAVLAVLGAMAYTIESSFFPVKR
jgi:basic amino acid/polyamine antiporter, APA family